MTKPSVGWGREGPVRFADERIGLGPIRGRGDTGPFRRRSTRSSLREPRIERRCLVSGTTLPWRVRQTRLGVPEFAAVSERPYLNSIVYSFWSALISTVVSDELAWAYLSSSWDLFRPVT